MTFLFNGVLYTIIICIIIDSISRDGLNIYKYIKLKYLENGILSSDYRKWSTFQTSNVSSSTSDFITSYQEYIIKERREYRTRLCSALNVCGESRAWNANYLTTISEYVIVYKRPRAFPS